MSAKTVPEMLSNLASIYQQRGAIYSDNYKHAGEVFMGLFPRGVNIQSADEFNRLHLIVHMASKLSRYCMNLKNGGHVDSLDDLAVYSQMAQECDADERARKPPSWGVDVGVKVRDVRTGETEHVYNNPIKKMIDDAMARYDAMTPEEQRQMWADQRMSWARQMMD